MYGNKLAEHLRRSTACVPRQRNQRQSEHQRVGCQRSRRPSDLRTQPGVSAQAKPPSMASTNRYRRIHVRRKSIPNARIRATGGAVAIVLAVATAIFPPANRSPIMPEPTTAAKVRRRLLRRRPAGRRPSCRPMLSIYYLDRQFFELENGKHENNAIRRSRTVNASRKRQRNLLRRPLFSRRIENRPSAPSSMPWPKRTNFAGCVVAHCKYKIHLRRIRPGKFIPTLAAQSGCGQPSQFKLPNRLRVNASRRDGCRRYKR